MGYLAGQTTTLELTTGVIVLPQRQAPLVAKQAAEVDILSGGRLRLGVGSGWNHVEYEGMGEDFSTRGRRQEEQVKLLRDLWSEESLTMRGQWHRIDRMGLKPRPGRAIPIWFGGGADRLLERAGRIGDGWIATRLPIDEASAVVDRLRGSANDAGRDPAAFGIEARSHVSDGPDRWAAEAKTWDALGASHISVATMDAGLDGAAGHLEVLRQYKETVG
jgi:probable F420-dependent oxidoreductase